MKKINWSYAIGEIIIVLIGISLAFALNSWKENWNHQKLRIQYLDNLILDIEKEIEQLSNNQQQFTDKLATIEQISPWLGQPNGRPDSIAQPFFTLFNPINFHPENTTYQVLINSGDMRLIKDFQLRRAIEEHFAIHEKVLQQYKRIENINERYVADFFMHEIDYSKMRQRNYDFLDLPLLKNIINSIRGSFYMAIAANKECLESNQALLDLIKKHRVAGG